MKITHCNKHKSKGKMGENRHNRVILPLIDSVHLIDKLFCHALDTDLVNISNVFIFAEDDTIYKFINKFGMN